MKHDSTKEHQRYTITDVRINTYIYGAFVINELSPRGVSTLIGGHVIAIIRSVGLSVSDTY